MLVSYDTEKINRAMRDFYNATGIEMELLKPDFTTVSENRFRNVRYCGCVQSTEDGKVACRMSDFELLKKCRESKRTEMGICHAGLLNVAIPLLYDGVIIGYIIFGRIKPDRDFEPFYEQSRSLMWRDDGMGELGDELEYFGAEKINSISNIAIMLAKYLLLKNMLKPALGSNIQRAVEYINENLGGELSIAELPKRINVSKSVLYKDFHDQFGCTVSEYIKDRRVERSIELMNTTDMSIEEISQKVGFASAAYYCRVFKNYMGIPPAKYKRKLIK